PRHSVPPSFVGFGRFEAPPQTGPDVRARRSLHPARAQNPLRSAYPPLVLLRLSALPDTLPEPLERRGRKQIPAFRVSRSRESPRERSCTFRNLRNATCHKEAGSWPQPIGSQPQSPDRQGSGSPSPPSGTPHRRARGRCTMLERPARLRRLLEL